MSLKVVPAEKLKVWIAEQELTKESILSWIERFEEEHYCYWTASDGIASLDNAREDKYPDKGILFDKEDGAAVMELAESNWDCSLGLNWEDVDRASTQLIDELVLKS